MTKPLRPEHKKKKNKKIKKIINVEAELVHEFNRMYPYFGAFTWFVNEAMRQYLGLSVQVDPHETIANAIKGLKIPGADEDELPPDLPFP